MEQSKGKVNLTEEELRKELRITKKSDNWSQRLADGKMKIINLSAKNPHLLGFKIQTLWNHFWKVLSEFWQTWGNTCTKYLHRVFLHKNVALLLAENFCEFSTLYSIFFILNLVSGHLGIHLGIGQSAAFGKKMNVSLQNVKF